MFAVLVRMLPAAALVSSSGTLFFGNDAYYHLRRIEHALVHFPHVLGFDPYLNFPDGGMPIWPSLFDGLLALVLLPVHAASGMHGVEQVALWIPPIVGGLCVVVTHGFAREFFGWRCALASGVILALLSGHIWYSQAGFLDHHCAVALIATLLTWRTARQLERSPARRGHRREAIALGTLAAGALLLWPGALLFVAIAEIALFLHCATRPERADAQRAAGNLAMTNAVAFACVTPFALGSNWLQWGPMSPVVISYFQPWAFGILCVAALGCRLCFARATSGWARTSTALSIVIALAGVSLLGLPGLREGAVDAWQWLARDESFQQTVSESAPLFVMRGQLDADLARRRLSDLLFVFPFALAWLVCSRHRTRSARVTLLLVGTAIGLAGVALAQRRFFNELTPLFAIACGWSLLQVAAMLRRTGVGRVGAAALVGAGAIGLLWPSLGELRAPLEQQLDWWAGEPVQLKPTAHRNRATVRAANWLRDASPPPADWNRDDALPSYGVIADWSRGHVLLYESRRPTVVGNFGDDLGGANMTRVAAYFASEESRALEIAADVRARYVVSVVRLSDRAPIGGPDSMRSRLAGSETTRRGLAHHRLVYQSTIHLEGGEPMVRIYELVHGAEIVGRAMPGAIVVGSISLHPKGQPSLRMQYETRTRADGEYRLRIPYSTGGDGAVAAGSLRLESEGQHAELEIPEAAARDAWVLAAPAMR